ncbi:MAG: hypothetical protein WBM46_02095 [Polyangiales bacterium]
MQALISRLSILSVSLVALPAAAVAQSGGWGEPIAAPSKAEPEPTEPGRGAPNPSWSDAPPTEYEQRSRDNPDWVAEAEVPPLGAQKPPPAEGYGVRYANRDLTMPRGMMRGSFDTIVGRRTEQPVGARPNATFGPTGTISTMSFGAAISLAEGFEVGFSPYRMGSFPGISVFPSFGFGDEGLVAFSMSPEAKFGDIPLYARFEAFGNDTVKLGIDAVFRIPVRTEFGFLAGVPLRFIVQQRMAFDTGFQIAVDNNPQGPAVWTLNVPFTFVANATDQFFVMLNSGMSFFDLSQTLRTVTSGLVQGPFYLIPLGVGAGYTVESSKTMIDIFASFRFPALYGFTSRASELNQETWQVTIGLNVYSPVLFKRKQL